MKKKFLNFSFLFDTLFPALSTPAPFNLYLRTVSLPQKIKFIGQMLHIFPITYRHQGFAFLEKRCLCLSGEQRSSVRTPALSSGRALHQLSPRAEPCGKNPVLPAAILSQLFGQGLHQGASSCQQPYSLQRELIQSGKNGLYLFADCDQNR